MTFDESVCYAMGVESAQSPEAASQGGRLASIVAWTALALALVAAVTQFGWQRDRLVDAWPMIMAVNDPEAQHSRIGQDYHYPHDLLASADAAMPLTATVLLVTPGTRTTDYEFTTYNRAVYRLSPRSVWWLVPTPPDESWKARWWISAPTDAESIRSAASDRGADYVLQAGLDVPLDGGRAVMSTPEGSLVRLNGAEANAEAPRPQYVQPLGLLALLPGLAIPFVLGAGMLRLARRWGYPARGVESLALAWALGAGLLSILMLGLLALGAGWTGTMAVLSVAALGVAAYLLARRDPAPPREATSARTPLNVLELALLAIVAVVAAYVAVMAVGRPLTIWDSWVNWASKARSIFYDGAIGPAVYSDPSRGVTLLDYPLHLPLLEAWVFRWAGAPDDRLVGVVHLLFYLSLVGLTFAAARGAGVPRTLALVTATVVAATMLMAALAADGFAESALTVYVLAAGAYLLKWLRGGPPGALLIAAVAGGLIAWTKREGIVLLAVLCLAVVIAGITRRRAWIGAGALALGGAALAGPWYAFVALFGHPNPAYVPVSIDAFVQNSGRISLIARHARDVLLHARLGWLWPLTFAAGFAALVTGARRRLDRWSAVVPVFALVYGATASMFYVFSAFEPLETHLLTSVERLFAPLLPLLAVWISSLGSLNETQRRNDAKSLLKHRDAHNVEITQS